MKQKIKVFVLCILLFIPFVSHAQYIVHDPLQTAAVLGSLGEQLKQLKDEVKSLQSFNWNDTDNTKQLQNLTNYLQQSGSLASSANSVASEFQKYFPGYNPSKGSDYNSQYSHIITDTNTALQSVMQVMASINSQSDPMSQNDNLSKIQMQISGAANTVQATQGLAQITAQLASNLEVLQKTVAAQASAQDAYYATQLQTQASNQAGMKQMFDNGQKTAPPIGHSGESIHFVNP